MSGMVIAYTYCVRDTPMPNGNQIPGTPIGSSNSPPKNAAMIEANVTSASILVGPSQTMRTAIARNSAIDPSLLTRVTLAVSFTAPKSPATASTTAATSMLRHGREHQRFHASVQAATVGTHIHDASH